MDGILQVDKPKGWTSHDVVAKVRNILRQAQKSEQTRLSHLDAVQGSNTVRKIRVGHTGTLDPLATGLLVLVIGSYTKRAKEFSKMDKTYEVTMKLGFVSETGDEEGKKTKISDKIPSQEQIQAVLAGFVGEIEQIPPKFSAIKVDGQRAYKLAREGKEVKLQSRIIKIHAIADEIIKYPYITFTTEVSSGTYIRTLVEDIGTKLETGAYMSELRRTQVGQFSVKDAVAIDDKNLPDNNSIISRVAPWK